MDDVILASFVAALAPFTVVSPTTPVDTTIAPPPTCATYSIEGSLDSIPGPQNADAFAPQLEISATAYLHDGGEALVGHQVIAVFEMADGSTPVDPVRAVTDGDGRVSILLPVGAVGVSFRAESAAVGECPDVAPGDVPVVVVDVPIVPPGFSEGVSTPVEPPTTPGSTLPVTGPQDGLVLVAGLVLAVGLGTMASRSRRSAEEPRVFPR